MNNDKDPTTNQSGFHGILYGFVSRCSNMIFLDLLHKDALRVQLYVPGYFLF